MEFPVRAFDALFMHDYRTAGDFFGKIENDIRGLHGVGRRRLRIFAGCWGSMGSRWGRSDFWLWGRFVRRGDECYHLL